MRILVTGITGRIGANLAADLLKQGHQIRGLVWERDERVAKLEDLDVELEYGTITNADDALRATDGVDAVYHLAAAFQGGGPFTDEEYFEINVRGTFNMLEAARAHGRVRHFIHASTDAVYGGHQVDQSGGELISEDDAPRRPATWYALSKHLAEEVCHGYHRIHSFPVTMMRFAWAHSGDEILRQSYFYLSLLKKRYPELEELWDGEERLVLLRDREGKSCRAHMVDVRDLVHGLVCALDKPESYGQVFNLAAPRAFSWEEVVPHLSQALEIPWIEATLSGSPIHYQLDISKAQKTIGYKPQYDMIRMINDGLAVQRGEDLGILPT
jgi:nucleoside-diphosphate-sugar epimerase